MYSVRFAFRTRDADAHGDGGAGVELGGGGGRGVVALDALDLLAATGVHEDVPDVLVREAEVLVARQVVPGPGLPVGAQLRLALVGDDGDDALDGRGPLRRLLRLRVGAEVGAEGGGEVGEGGDEDGLAAEHRPAHHHHVRLLQPLPQHADTRPGWPVCRESEHLKPDKKGRHN